MPLVADVMPQRMGTTWSHKRLDTVMRRGGKRKKRYSFELERLSGSPSPHIWGGARPEYVEIHAPRRSSRGGYSIAVTYAWARGYIPRSIADDIGPLLKQGWKARCVKVGGEEIPGRHRVRTGLPGDWEWEDDWEHSSYEARVTIELEEPEQPTIAETTRRRKGRPKRADGAGPGQLSLTLEGEETVTSANPTLGFSDGMRVPRFSLYGGILTGYNWYEEEIEIPPELGIHTIGAHAFNKPNINGVKYYKIKRVVIPEGVTRIEDEAFSGCDCLEEVSFPSSLRLLGKAAFKGCKSLRELSLPDGIEQVGEAAFEGCRGLAKVTFPAAYRKVTICRGAFRGCGIESLNLLGSYTIDCDAFEDCKSLTTLRIEAINDEAVGHQIGCDDIGIAAFEGCTSLREVELPETLFSISFRAFSGTDIFRLRLPAGLSRIGSHAFEGCRWLFEVTLESPWCQVEQFAFSGCSGLTIFRLASRDYRGWVYRSAFDGCTRFDADAFFRGLPPAAEVVDDARFSGMLDGEAHELIAKEHWYEVDGRPVRSVEIDDVGFATLNEYGGEEAASCFISATGDLAQGYYCVTTIATFPEESLAFVDGHRIIAEGYLRKDNDPVKVELADSFVFLCGCTVKNEKTSEELLVEERILRQREERDREFGRLSEERSSKLALLEKELAVVNANIEEQSKKLFGRSKKARLEARRDEILKRIAGVNAAYRLSVSRLGYDPSELAQRIARNGGAR